MTVPTARPRLHLTADHGWVNDPHGLTYHDGRYHLFVQHVPGVPQWQPGIVWGHATSTDLLGWQWQPVAVAPGEGDDGIWTGCVVVDQDQVHLLYTAVSLGDLDHGRVRVAHPADAGWTTWVKGDVLVESPAEPSTIAFRDPQVVRVDDGWLMVVGAGLADGRAGLLGYRSLDLVTWSGPDLLADRPGDLTDPVWAGAGWECPQLFPLDGRWVLAVGVWDTRGVHDEVYAIGDLVDGRYVVERWDRAVFGPCYYAASTFVDAQGERGLVHWLRGVGDEASGWQGAISLPHRVRLVEGRLVAEPPASLASRRGAPVVVTGAGATVSPVCEIAWEPAAGERLTVVSGRETLLEVTTGADTWQLAASGGEPIVVPWFGGPIRLVLDGPVVEVFGDAGVAGDLVPTPAGELEVRSPGLGRAVVWPLNEEPR